MKSTSAWSPLRHALYRNLWIAALASNIGTTMHDVGAAWLMATLTKSAIMISLMQTASSLPIFLVALPAGALADLVDRRRLLIVTQAWMMVAAGCLGLLSFPRVALISPWLLLFLTFMLGLGGAVNNPAWQATTPELVPPADLHKAIALNGVGFNLARSVGPAIGGLIVAAAGPWAVFALNGLSFLGVILVFYRWERKTEESEAPTERMLGAMRAGSRYVLHAPAFMAVLMRTGVFIICGSAFWGLLPYLAKHELNLSALSYGILLGCFGAGAVSAANLLPRVRRKVSIDGLVSASTLIFAVVALGLGYLRVYLLVAILMACGGAAWMALMSTLNASAQTSVPAWVRARALAIYLLVFQGGLAIGSVLWGTIADHVGVRVALSSAAIGMLAGLAVVPHFRLEESEGLDLSPSHHWPDPVVHHEPSPEHGPVLILVEYQIEPSQVIEFARAMRAVRTVRRRDGAIRWGLYHDVAEPGRVLETYVVESWAEHLRQHERFTVADIEIETYVRSFHRGDKPPIVTHLVSAYGYAEGVEQLLSGEDEEDLVTTSPLNL